MDSSDQGGPYWVTKRKSKILISEMTDFHLVCTNNMLERMIADNRTLPCNFFTVVQIDMEVERRNLKGVDVDTLPH